MSYDNWKLSNPIDDGFYTGMVSRCCGAEIGTTNISNCCSAKVYDDTDVCKQCKEHADLDDQCCLECGDSCETIEDYEYIALEKESREEMMRDGDKDEY